MPRPRRDPDPRGSMGNRRVVIGLFQCQDGSWVQMHTAPRGGFNRLMRAVGLDELADPTREELRIASRLSAVFSISSPTSKKGPS